jgi:hypothetical protein
LVGLQRNHDVIDNLRRCATCRIDLNRDGAIGVATLVEEVADALAALVAATGEQGPIGVLFHTVKDGTDGSCEANDGSGFGKHLAIAGVDQRTAACAEDETWLLGKLGAELRFEDAEGWLTILGKDAGDGLAKVRLNLGIHVHKLAMQLFG